MNEDRDISLWSINEFEYFVKSYENVFIAFAYRYINDYSLAEDVVQDCLCQLWIERKKNRKTKIRNASLFVMTMIKNKALNYNRSDRYVFNLDFFSENFIVDNVIEEIIKNESQYIVGEILKKIPERWRQVLTLYMNGASNKEIALEMNITVDSVKAIKTRAFERLRKVIPLELK